MIIGLRPSANRHGLPNFRVIPAQAGFQRQKMPWTTVFHSNKKSNISGDRRQMDVLDSRLSGNDGIIPGFLLLRLGVFA
jgi:hypothetical protein